MFAGSFSICCFVWKKLSFFDHGVVNVSEEGVYAELSFDGCLLFPWVVDETATKGIQMFRLAESTNAILVHEELRDVLLEKGFGSDIAFYDFGEAAI